MAAAASNSIWDSLVLSNIPTASDYRQNGSFYRAVNGIMRKLYISGILGPVPQPEQLVSNESGLSLADTAPSEPEQWLPLAGPEYPPRIESRAIFRAKYNYLRTGKMKMKVMEHIHTACASCGLNQLVKELSWSWDLDWAIRGGSKDYIPRLLSAEMREKVEQLLNRVAGFPKILEELLDRIDKPGVHDAIKDMLRKRIEAREGWAKTVDHNSHASLVSFEATCYLCNACAEKACYPQVPSNPPSTPPVKEDSRGSGTTARSRRA